MQHTSHSLGPLFAEIRDELRGMRAARAARKELRRELAVATSPNDLLELDAIIARYDDDETADLRSVLNERRLALAGYPAPVSAFPGRTSGLS
jgi:hypothetical protein